MTEAAKRSTLLLAIVLAALPCRAQRVEAHLSVDSASIGERFSLIVYALHAFPGEPSFPAAAATDSTFGDLEVLGIHGAGSRMIDGARLDSVVYDVTSFALDSAHVPPLPVTFEGGAATATTEELMLPMKSLVEPGAAAVRDITQLEEFGMPPWPYVLLGLAAVLAGALLVYFLRRKKQPLVLEADPEPPRVSPYEEALERLRRLEDARPAVPPEVKYYYVELSAALRAYFEGALGLPALEQTTRELVQDFDRATVRHLVPGSIASRTENTLGLADLVKFADFLPPTADHARAVDEAITIVEQVQAKLNQIARERERVQTVS